MVTQAQISKALKPKPKFVAPKVQWRKKSDPFVSARMREKLTIYTTIPKNIVDLPHKPMYDYVGQEIKVGDVVVKVSHKDKKNNPQLSTGRVYAVVHSHVCVVTDGSFRVTFTPRSDRMVVITGSEAAKRMPTKDNIRWVVFGKRPKKKEKRCQTN